MRSGSSNGNPTLSKRTRDRRGRGLRGPLAPPEVPITRSRAECFDDLVSDEVRRLAERWATELAGVEFAVEEVPPIPPQHDDAATVPLGRLDPAAGARPPRIIVYRRPLEARGGESEADLARLIKDVVVEEVADLLGLSPESVDPSYDDPS